MACKSWDSYSGNNKRKPERPKEKIMTDKQIIIDGVDVSGCTNYADGKCTNSQMIQSNCKNVAVCYYKEYKRKEQECEKLKEARKNSRCAWKSFEGTFCPEAERLLKAQKKENDELKNKIKFMEEDIKIVENIRDELEKTLTEINKCLTKNAEKGWVSTSEIDDILKY